VSDPTVKRSNGRIRRGVVRQHGKDRDGFLEMEWGDNDKGDWGWNRRIPRRNSVGDMRWRERDGGMMGDVGRRAGLR
jgi:hypothetical protein